MIKSKGDMQVIHINHLEKIHINLQKHAIIGYGHKNITSQVWGGWQGTNESDTNALCPIAGS